MPRRDDAVGIVVRGTRGSSTVLPALIDAHTHLFLQGENPAAGFFTLRDMETEGAGYGDIGIKQAMDEGIRSRAAELASQQGGIP